MNKRNLLFGFDLREGRMKAKEKEGSKGVIEYACLIELQITQER